MGYAPVCTPTGSMNMHESDPEPSLKSKLLYEETKLNVGAYSNTCKNWCHHARIGVCPSMNITNQQAEGVLDILDPLHPLSLIVDQRWRDETKNNMRSQYPSRNGALEASRTPISRLSLSEWNASKQTWDLIASGWSYDLDHNEA